MSNTDQYIVVGIRPWNKELFDEVISKFPGNWHFISDPKDLTTDNISVINPRYVFFLHWSEKVPKEIFEKYESVCLHMTDVPYGRGGSPLQNLIVRGHRHTKLTALRMVEDFDAGPVYLKEDLCLEGNAEEVYIRASYMSAKMIRHIIEEKPVPEQQAGEEVVFKRRKPHESRIPKLSNLQALHDHIRMLDAEEYPRAFLEYTGFRYEFSRAALYNGRIIADVVITPIERKN